jgi:hypothetical protein
MQRDNRLSGVQDSNPEIVLTDREGVYIRANCETADHDHPPIHAASHRLF